VVVLRPALQAGAYILCLFLLTGAAGAQLGDNLSVYSEKNATGYIQPLADAVGVDLNSGIFRSAHIPASGFHLSLEVPVMIAKFGDDDRTFTATTEEGFYPEQSVEAPTVAGPSDALIADGAGGTQFAFPGGLDLNSFALASPQLRVGSYRGTDLIFRFLAVDVGDDNDELGSVSLFGLGVQHSISQYLEREIPVELAAGFFWQTYSIGKNESGSDLLSGTAFTLGVQASRRFGRRALYLEPYGGLSIDNHSLEVSYESDTSGEPSDVTLDAGYGTTYRLLIGATFRIYYLAGYIDYNITTINTISFGITIGN
jgi:hypothetical protein